MACNMLGINTDLSSNITRKPTNLFFRVDIIQIHQIILIGVFKWLTIDTTDLLGVLGNHMEDIPDLTDDHIVLTVTAGDLLTEDIIPGETSADGRS